MLLPRERQPLRSDTCRYNHSRHACSMRLRCTSCCKMDDGNRVSADAPFWWTSLPQLHTFTLSSADALWLKGVREGALAVARTPWSDAVGRRTAQLGECQNYFVTMGIQNRDKSCSPTRSGHPKPIPKPILALLSGHFSSTQTHRCRRSNTHRTTVSLSPYCPSIRMEATPSDSQALTATHGNMLMCVAHVSHAQAASDGTR